MVASAFSLLFEGVQRAINRLGWKELRPIQVEGIQTVLGSDDDLIIAAPTAGGKTEAAFLPIVSVLAKEPEKIAIYISPLKALINDQWGRLDRLCAELDVPVRRWHGDVSAAEKKDFRAHPRGILLITPESLESNFVNYGGAVPRIYAQTAFVVIDELHAFVDGVRGMHLRSLVTRLCATAGCRPRFAGLSATLGDPAAAQRFLRPDEPSRVRLIRETGGGREIRLGLRASLERPRLLGGNRLVRRLTHEETARVVDCVVGEAWRSDAPLAPLGATLGLGPSTEAELPRDALDEIADDLAAHFQAGTNLVFGNSRRTLEELADILHELAHDGNWVHDPFCVHHGSLSKATREEVEERLRSTAPTTALCTSTLELGIDIGSIRTVGQIDPPWSVAALVQRLGRSGRRVGEAARLRLYARDETPHPESTLSDLLFPRLLRSISVVELMLSKWTEPNASERMHLSTLVHQLLSVLRQTGGLAAEELYRILCVAGPFRAVDPLLFKRILRALGDGTIIEQVPTGEIILAPAGEHITSTHDFYAAFVSNEIFIVRHGDDLVGEMPADNVPPVGQYFILSGRRWEVTDIAPREKLVWVRPTRERVPPLFGGDGGDIDGRIFEQMRALLVSEEVPGYLDHGSRVLLNCARQAARGSGAGSQGVVFTEKLAIWYPWVGTRVFRTLRLMLAALKEPHDYDALSIRLPHHDRARLDGLLERLDSASFDAVGLAAGMEVKAFDKYDELLGESILDEMNARDRLDVAGAKSAARRTRAQLAMKA